MKHQHATWPKVTWCQLEGPMWVSVHCPCNAQWTVEADHALASSRQKGWAWLPLPGLTPLTVERQLLILWHIYLHVQVFIFSWRFNFMFLFSQFSKSRLLVISKLRVTSLFSFTYKFFPPLSGSWCRAEWMSNECTGSGVQMFGLWLDWKFVVLIWASK